MAIKDPFADLDKRPTLDTMQQAEPAIPKEPQAEAEEPEKEEPLVGPPYPSPVKPPEYYPGYNAEIDKYATTFNDTAGRLETIEERKAKALELNWKDAPIPAMIEAKKQIDQLNAQSAAIKQEQVGVIDTVKSANWRLTVLNTLPIMMMMEGYKENKLASSDDVLRLIESADATDEDKLWLKDTYGKLEYLKPKLPEDYNPDWTIAEVQQKLLADTVAKNKDAALPMRAVSSMAISELAKYFSSSEQAVAQLPEGIEPEEYRQLMGKMELPEEDKIKAEEFILENLNAWKIESERMRLIKEGILNAAAPELTPKDLLNMLLTQPMMATAEFIDKMYTYTLRPFLAAGAMATWGKIDTTPDDSKIDQLETIYNNYVAEGHNHWEAMGLAYKDWDINWGIKLAAEIIFDPTTYFGIGLFAKAASKAGSLFVKAGQSSRLLNRLGASRIGTRIGPMTAAFEQGVNDISGAVFKAGKEVVLAPVKTGFWAVGAGYGIPKTTTAMAKEFAQDTITNFIGVLQSRYPNMSKLNNLSILHIEETIDEIGARWLKDPMQAGDKGIRAFSDLAEYAYLEGDDLSRLLKKATDILPSEYNTNTLYHLNDDVLNMLSGISSPKLTASNMLERVVGSSKTSEMIDNLAAELTKLRSGMVDNVKKLFVGEKVSSRILNAFDSVMKTRLANLNNKISLHATQAGRATSWVSQAANRVYQSNFVQNMEQRLMMPVARWNLIFLSFGPANWFEGMWRGFLGGGDLLVPKDYGGVVEYGEHTFGLSNVDWRYRMMERDMLYQPYSEKVVHRSPFDRDGKIIGVTQPIIIGGKEKGPSIGIYGETFKLSHLGAWNDPWDYAVQMQQMHFNAKRYSYWLEQLDTETFTAVKTVITNRHNELKAMDFLDRSDYAGIERLAQNNITTGYSERVRLMADISSHQLTRNKIAQSVAQPLNDAVDMYHAVRHYVKESILDGSGLRDIGAFEKAAIAMQRDMDMVSLKPQIERMKNAVQQFGEYPIETVDDLLSNMDLVAKIERGNQATAEYFRSVTVLRANELSMVERDAFYIGSAKIFKEYMDTTGDTLSKMVKKLEADAKIVGTKAARKYNRQGGKFWREVRDKETIPDGVGSRIDAKTNTTYIEIDHAEYLDGIRAAKANKPLTEPMQQTISELNRLHRARIENDATMMKEIYDVESAISKTPAKGRNEAFWSKQRALKNEIWAKGKSNRVLIENDLLIQERRFLTSTGKEPFLPKKLSFQTGKNIQLTLANVAEMMGGTAEQSMKLIDQWTTHIITNPKDDFINMVRQQADIFASKGKQTADDIGFSKVAIGDVYDSMWTQLGIDPYKLAPDEKVLRETKVIFDEIRRSYASMKVSESDAQKWSKYWNGLADDMESIPTFAKETPEALKGVKVTTTELDPAKSLDKGLLDLFPGYKGYEVKLSLPSVEGGATESYIRYFTKEGNLIIDDIISQTAMPPGKMAAALGEILSSPANRGKMVLTTPLTNKGKRFLGILEKKGFIKTKSPPQQYIDDINKTMQTRPGLTGHELNPPLEIELVKAPSTGSITKSESWQATRSHAMELSNEDTSRAFPTYGKDDIIDETMKTFFPFWTYEKFRWNWLGRTFLEKPGTLINLGKFMDYSDGGYIPIPFTDMQINPLRGSIWMGGLRSIYNKDFPEYYNQFPGLELFESLGRYGFFPGLPIQVAMVFFGQKGGVPETSELLPPWVTTPLSFLRFMEDKIAPNGPHGIAKIIDIVAPDRFRDYQTMLTLGKWGYDADAIWKKKQKKEKLTPEEEALWGRAAKDANGLRAILMEQTGLLRYRPEKYDEMKLAMKQAIEDMTGVPIAVQEEIDRQYPTTGKRFTDYYHLDVYQQKLLYMNEVFRKWQGVSESLLPAGYKAMEMKITQYYEELDELEKQIRRTGAIENGEVTSYSIENINEQFVEEDISADQWTSRRSDLVSKLATMIEALSNSYEYKDVPKSLEERELYAKETGTVPPTLLPDQELMNYYYSIQPEMAVNPETGIKELDFDTYYAYVDNLLSSMDSTYRDRMLARIQFDWTGLEKLYWNISREYIRPYNNVRNIVLASYSKEAQLLISRYTREDTIGRDTIQEIKSESGRKLISEYNAKLTASHEAMRQADPELDAWLNFWGKVDSFKTPEAKEKFIELKKQYKTKDMIK
jgi:hypothetical protein